MMNLNYQMVFIVVYILRKRKQNLLEFFKTPVSRVYVKNKESML